MKVDKPRSDHINQTFHIDHLTEEDKNSDNFFKDQTQTKFSLFALKMVSSAKVQRIRSKVYKKSLQD